MTYFQLTPHFNLSEFEKSQVAITRHIDNSVPARLIPVLEQLCKEVLEPLRTFAGQPILISSGYRSPSLNVCVGGAYTSQHSLGEAADIRIPLTSYTAWDDNRAHTDRDILNRWFDFIISHTDFDQAIIETANDKDFWIHVSCRRNKRKNRHQVIRYLKK